MPSIFAKARRLRELILAPEILTMPGVFDPISAILAERAGFDALQCSGLAISATHLGKPDYSFLSLGEMVERTRVIASAVEVPVMADGDTGFGNAVNAYHAVRAFEDAGAAGVNIEDQILPKRCGHLHGKSVLPIGEASEKITAACAARRCNDFVIHARTDALAVEGLHGAINRANAYLACGATAAFVDGVSTHDEVAALVAGIRGPVSVNIVEGGRTGRLSVGDMQALGVSRVSFPATSFLASLEGMRRAYAALRRTGDPNAYCDALFGFSEMQELIGMAEINALELRFGIQNREGAIR